MRRKKPTKVDEFDLFAEEIALTILKNNNFIPFYLQRDKDVSGTSGVGVVAIGFILPSGKCIMEWNSEIKTETIFNSINDIEKIHGHNNATKIIIGFNKKLSETRKEKN